jgi:hypothetical protein
MGYLHVLSLSWQSCAILRILDELNAWTLTMQHFFKTLADMAAV